MRHSASHFTMNHDDDDDNNTLVSLWSMTIRDEPQSILVPEIRQIRNVEYHDNLFMVYLKLGQGSSCYRF